MARYADTLLAEGEHIVLRTRQHWFATIVDGRVPWALFLASLVLLVLTFQVDAGGVRDVLGYVVAAALLVSLAWLAKHYWSWVAQDYIVTNRRVLKVGPRDGPPLLEQASRPGSVPRKVILATQLVRRRSSEGGPKR
ncbi:MAG: hypothetical protein L0227_19605 [Chloroflexi bacterium]|nr:hypothetical protein [Chloroflexota bacterium]